MMFKVHRGSQGKVKVIGTDSVGACLAEWPADEAGLIQAQHVADSLNEAYVAGMRYNQKAVQHAIGLLK